uniref:Uncharacterized protein n=1 Tax=Romanomermis culicivorax TaxID=13658 RepID=A0A915JRR6_ROMCU
MFKKFIHNAQLYNAVSNDDMDEQESTFNEPLDLDLVTTGTDTTSSNLFSSDKMIRGILISRSKSQKSPKIEKDGSRQSESVKKRFGVSGDVLSTSSLSSSSTNWLTSNSSIDHGPQMPDLLVDHVTDKMRRSSVGACRESYLQLVIMTSISTMYPSAYGMLFIDLSKRKNVVVHVGVPTISTFSKH